MASIPGKCAAATLLVAVVVFSSPACAQITVGPAGSGAAFSEIQPALLAAAPGATILVAPGDYAPFVVTQAVSIVGAGAGLSTISIPAGSPAGAIAVAAIPGGQTVRISGLSLSQTSASPAARIAVTQCNGRVELVGVESQGVLWGSPTFVDKATLVIENSAAVLLDGCALRGSYPPFAQNWMAASPGIEVINSNVWCNASEVQGGQGGEGYGGDGILVSGGSFLHLSRCHVIGGGGGAHFGFYWWDIYGFSGEEAIDVVGSQVVIAGGPNNTCEGGPGVLLGVNDWTDGGSAVRLRDNASLRYASDAVLLHGPDGNGSTVGPLVSYAPTTPGVVDIAEPGVRATLAFVPAAAAPGQTVALDASGDAGATHFVFAALVGTPPLPLPGTGMHVHIDPGTLQLLTTVGLDATGSGSLAATLPSTPLIAGAQLIVQSIDANLSAIRLSNPALFTVTP